MPNTERVMAPAGAHNLVTKINATGTESDLIQDAQKQEVIKIGRVARVHGPNGAYATFAPSLDHGKDIYRVGYHVQEEGSNSIQRGSLFLDQYNQAYYIGVERIMDNGEVDPEFVQPSVDVFWEEIQATTGCRLAKRTSVPRVFRSDKTVVVENRKVEQPPFGFLREIQPSPDVYGAKFLEAEFRQDKIDQIKKDLKKKDKKEDANGVRISVPKTFNEAFPDMDFKQILGKPKEVERSSKDGPSYYMVPSSSEVTESFTPQTPIPNGILQSFEED
jgi:hypothetical protein